MQVVFLVFPHYCLGRGLMDMATEENLNAAISQFGLESVRSRFAFAFLGKYMLCLLVQGVVFFLLTLAIQAQFWTWFSCTRRTTNSGQRWAKITTFHL
jgi:ATP-binding cassette subfamily A (ABC1) protein 4